MLSVADYNGTFSVVSESIANAGSTNENITDTYILTDCPCYAQDISADASKQDDAIRQYQVWNIVFHKDPSITVTNKMKVIFNGLRFNILNTIPNLDPIPNYQYRLVIKEIGTNG